MQTDLFKVCNVCRKTKTADMYGRNATHSSGLNSWCKACVSAENARRAAAKNAWRDANRERCRDVNRRSVARNIESARASKSEWVKRNAENVNARTARRRALKLNATPRWANHSEILRIYRSATELSVKTGEQWTVDHIVPLRSKLVCGLHCEANLRVITKVENSIKGNRHWPDMP